MRPTIIFDSVSKKFGRTYVSDSLRDVLAEPFRKLWRGHGRKYGKGNKELWALRDVSFEVNPGESLGIIGRNGSGKTTILRVLSRILRPDGGRVEVQGRVSALIELTAGFNTDLSGRENVFLNATILGMNRQEIKEKYDEIVEFSELEPFMDTPVKWYSTGMIARLGFSIAVHTEPNILLIDEVLSVGDEGFQRKCFDKMKSFKDRGITMVFVSHNLQAVTYLCDKAILLSKGAVVTRGHPNDVVGEYLQTVTKQSNTAIQDASIKFVGGGIFDGDGMARHSFKSGEQVRVDIELLFQRAYPNIFIDSYIRLQSQLVFSTNSMRLTGESMSLEKGHSVLFSFALTLNLAPGTYRLGVSVFDRDGISNKWVFGQVMNSFVVDDDSRFDGIAFMEPKLLKLQVNS